NIMSDFTAWYITVKKPKFVNELEKLKLIQQEKTIQGLYKVIFPFPCAWYLLVINELAIVEENFFLLLLSSGESFRKFLQDLLKKKTQLDSVMKKYLSMRFVLDYKEVKQMEGIEDFFTPQIRKNIRLAIESIGINNVLDSLGMDNVIEAMGLEKVVDAISLEKVVDAIGLEKVVDAISLEKLVSIAGEKKILKVIGKEKIKKLLESLDNNDETD
ncbi:MAG: hypothetical protein ACTSYS_15850, partial [Promethearchaeota archaeon]